jgi:LysM repeat protein
MGRLRAAVAGLFAGGGRQQAMPLDRARGQVGPVVPYHERRQQLSRSRRQHSSYALVFIVVLLVLVVGIFNGLNWALSGAFSPGGARPTATVQVQPPGAPVVAPTSVSPGVVLPTPAPGGSSPSPSPLPGVAPAPGAPPTAPGPAQPAPGAGTPAPGAARSYTVKAGDTPGGIARQFNVSVEALMRANNISDPTKLGVGQTLTIPPESTPTPAPR